MVNLIEALLHGDSLRKRSKYIIILPRFEGRKNYIIVDTKKYNLDHLINIDDFGVMKGFHFTTEVKPAPALIKKIWKSMYYLTVNPKGPFKLRHEKLLKQYQEKDLPKQKMDFFIHSYNWKKKYKIDLGNEWVRGNNAFKINIYTHQDRKFKEIKKWEWYADIEDAVKENLFNDLRGKADILLDTENKRVVSLMSDSDSGMRNRRGADGVAYKFPDRGLRLRAADLKNVLLAVRKEVPHLDEYELEIDKYKDEVFSVGDWLEGRKMDSRSRADQTYKKYKIGKLEPFYAYHGTSLAAWKKIKEEGRFSINPDNFQYVDKDHFKSVSDSGLYLSLYPNVARRYAVRAAGARPGVVLEVFLRRPHNIYVDPDDLHGLRADLGAYSIKDNTDLRNLILQAFHPKDNEDLFRVYYTEEGYKRLVINIGEGRFFVSKEDTYWDYYRDFVSILSRTYYKGKMHFFSDRQIKIIKYLESIVIMRGGDRSFQYLHPERINIKKDVRVVETIKGIKYNPNKASNVKSKDIYDRWSRNNEREL